MNTLTDRQTQDGGEIYRHLKIEEEWNIRNKDVRKKKEKKKRK